MLFLRYDHFIVHHIRVEKDDKNSDFCSLFGLNLVILKSKSDQIIPKNSSCKNQQKILYSIKKSKI
jgi:hypothetical protein